VARVGAEVEGGGAVDPRGDPLVALDERAKVEALVPRTQRMLLD
jgi:hypothetical protein